MLAIPVGSIELRSDTEARPAVIVYTTRWCPACKQAKAWLNSNGVAYQERDVEASSEDARKMRLINPRGSIPTIDVDGEVLVGFSEKRMVSMLLRRQPVRIERKP